MLYEVITVQQSVDRKEKKKMELPGSSYLLNAAQMLKQEADAADARSPRVELPIACSLRPQPGQTAVVIGTENLEAKLSGR